MRLDKRVSAMHAQRMTAREGWKCRIKHRSIAELESDRAIYAAYIDVCERYPDLSSPAIHENAVTALREIDARLRREKA